MREFEYEVWSTIQDMTPKEVADVIDDSIAMTEAIRANEWTFVADIINKRVQNYATRRAELRVYNSISTKSIDCVQELEEYRVLRIIREEYRLQQKREMMDKIQDQFISELDE